MKIYHFIDCQKAEFAITTLCRVCEVATSSYYTWAGAEAAGPDDAMWDEAILANRIYDIWARSRGRYGAPRVTAQLWREATVVNHKRVERIMATLGLQGACGRRKLRTTVRDPGAAPAPDRVQRHFTSYRQDSLWIGDVTYVPTDEGWLAVPGHGDRHLLQAAPGLVHGRPHAHRARRRCPPGGEPHPRPLSVRRPHLSFRPRVPVHERGVQEAVHAHGHHTVNGHRRRQLRQCHGRELLCFIEAGAGGYRTLLDQTGGTDRNLRVDCLVQ